MLFLTSKPCCACLLTLTASHATLSVEYVLYVRCLNSYRRWTQTMRRFSRRANCERVRFLAGAAVCLRAWCRSFSRHWCVAPRSMIATFLQIGCKCQHRHTQADVDCMGPGAIEGGGSLQSHTRGRACQIGGTHSLTPRAPEEISARPLVIFGQESNRALFTILP